jgi:hypothetical protein
MIRKKHLPGFGNVSAFKEKVDYGKKAPYEKRIPVSSESSP